MADLDLIETDEAFAAQALSVGRKPGWDIDKVKVKVKVKVNDGDIALDYPIGLSGSQVLVTLLCEMNHRDARKGLATLYIGGGLELALTLHRD